MKKYLKTDDLQPQRSLTHTPGCPGRFDREVFPVVTHSPLSVNIIQKKRMGMSPEKDESKSDCVLEWQAEQVAERAAVVQRRS